MDRTADAQSVDPERVRAVVQQLTAARRPFTAVEVARALGYTGEGRLAGLLLDLEHAVELDLEAWQYTSAWLDGPWPDDWPDDALAWFRPCEMAPETRVDAARTARDTIARSLGLVDPAALDPDTRAELEAHLHGLCFPMAVALHRATGLPYALLLDEWTGQSSHAMVQGADGRYLDAIGWRAGPDLEHKFDAETPVLVPATEADLRAHSRTLGARHVARAAALLRRLDGHPAQSLGMQPAAKRRRRPGR